MSDLKQEFNQQKDRLKTAAKKLDLTKKTKKLKKLETKTAQPGFWDDRESAQEVVSQISNLKDIVNQFNEIKNQIDQTVSLVDLAKKEDEKFLKEELKATEKKLADLEKKTYLSGEYDENDAIISINAGQGGTEGGPCAHGQGA